MTNYRRLGSPVSKPEIQILEAALNKIPYTLPLGQVAQVAIREGLNVDLVMDEYCKKQGFDYAIGNSW